MVERDFFLMKPKHQYHLSQWGECVHGAQSLNKRRLFYESVFVQIDIRTLILKIREREIFHRKPKHRYHLPYRGERVYGAQSWNKTRLLCESIFVEIDIRTLILKMV